MGLDEFPDSKKSNKKFVQTYNPFVLTSFETNLLFYSFKLSS